MIQKQRFLVRNDIFFAKSPKLYFYDSGIVCALLGITSPEQITTHAMRGGMFESWVIADIHKYYFNQHRPAPTYFWRDNKGVEIDLIIETGEQVRAIEIKSSKTIGSNFFKNLDTYKKLAGKNLKDKYLIYGGEQSQNRSQIPVLSWREATFM